MLWRLAFCKASTYLCPKGPRPTRKTDTMAQWLDMILQDRVNPDTFHRDFPWAEDMIGCPHDAVYHAEGDPWVHTLMVTAALRDSQAYSDMDDDRRAVLRLAAWFHDVAKPATTEVFFDEDLDRERVSQPGHAPLGASMAYQALIDAGAEVEMAREVHALVFWHQRPFHLIKENSFQQRVIRYSQDAGRGNWHELLTLCRADNLGRIAAGAQQTLEELDLLELAIEEVGENIGCDLVREPWPFESDEARVKYLRGPNDGSAFYMPADRERGRMTLMSGLPGAGKDMLIDARFPDTPVVSLDDIRGQMDVGWKDNQGQVLQTGFEAARVHMRAGQDFVWNATGITRQQRQKIIGLARDYDFAIDGISIDIPLQVARDRNRGRSRQVPDQVMQKLGRKRDPLLRDEVHRLWSVDEHGRLEQLFGSEIQSPECLPENA